MYDRPELFLKSKCCTGFHSQHCNGNVMTTFKCVLRLRWWPDGRAGLTRRVTTWVQCHGLPFPGPARASGAEGVATKPCGRTGCLVRPPLYLVRPVHCRPPGVSRRALLTAAEVRGFEKTVSETRTVRGSRRLSVGGPSCCSGLVLTGIME